MTKALITMLVKAWSDPLPKVGVRSDTSYLQRFIYAQRLIHNAEQFLGKKFWLLSLLINTIPTTLKTWLM